MGGKCEQQKTSIGGTAGFTWYSGYMYYVGMVGDISDDDDGRCGDGMWRNCTGSLNIAMLCVFEMDTVNATLEIDHVLFQASACTPSLSSSSSSSSSDSISLRSPQLVSLAIHHHEKPTKYHMQSSLLAIPPRPLIPSRVQSAITLANEALQSSRTMVAPSQLL